MAAEGFSPGVRCSVWLISSCVLVFAWCHFCACVWHYSGRSGWVVDKDLTSKPLVYQYLVSFNFAVAMLQVPTEVEPGDTMSERVYLAVMLPCSILVLALFLSHLTNCIFEEGQRRRDHDKRLEHACTYMSHHNVSMELRASIKQHIRYQLAAHNAWSTTDEVVCSCLPSSLKLQLLAAVREPMLAHNVLFHAWSSTHRRSFERLCNDVIRPGHYYPDDIVFSVDEPCKCMYFITSGIFKYLPYNTVTWLAFRTRFTETCRGSIKDMKDSMTARASMSSMKSDEAAQESNVKAPHSLCEAVIWCQWRYRGDLTATSLSSTFELDYRAFAELVHRYPAIKKLGSEHGVIFVQLLNSAGSCLSDRYNSNKCIEVCEDYETLAMLQRSIPGASRSSDIG